MTSTATHALAAGRPSAGAFDPDEALRRCAKGDRAALRALYEHEGPRMVGVAMRIVRRRALADEAVQDAFVQIWRRAETYDPALGSALTWIYAIVRHRALNILRDEARTEQLPEVETASEEEGAEHEDPEAMVLRLADGTALRRCLERLEPRRREAIVLAYVHGLTHAELAGRLQVPLGTMKSWIRRGLGSLRECLQ
jgi:RNA polymerase sigma-70 factor (ECF subfamily)